MQTDQKQTVKSGMGRVTETEAGFVLTGAPSGPSGQMQRVLRLL